MVILDEAYAEFVTEPDAVDGMRVLGLLGRPNVVALRTFSKAFGLAALRIGYAIGHPRVLDAARATMIPLSVTAQAQAAALTTLHHQAAPLERLPPIPERRDRLSSEDAQRGNEGGRTVESRGSP